MTQENKNSTNKKEKEAKNDNLVAALSYLWILVLVPLLLKKDSEFAQFHAKQGLTLFIAEIAIAMINIIPVLGQIIWAFTSIIFVIIAIIAIIKTLNGEKWEIPIIYDLSKKINL